MGAEWALGMVLLALVLLGIGVLYSRSRAAIGEVSESPSSVEPHGPPVDDAPRPHTGSAPSVPSAPPAAPPAAPPELAQAPPAAPARAGFFAGLDRTRTALLRVLLPWRHQPLDAEALQSLEDALVSADVGIRTAGALVDAVRAQLRADPKSDPMTVLRAELSARIGASVPLRPPTTKPHVLLVVGVNGSGKTTTIGKLAARYKSEGRSVLLGAGDTFRAGAIEQLQRWGERVGVPVVAHAEGADPAAVAYDAVTAGVARGVDVVICDTAGRLQAHRPLMDELGKVLRSIQKAFPGAPHEVLLVLDATIGQNGLSQARTFTEIVGATGVVLTKLDGTAKGGVVVAVKELTGIPVKLVGLGEKVDDLRDFDPEAFVAALTGTG